MNVPTITMDREQARDAYREYRAACRNNPSEADRVVMMGYKAMAQGRAIIDLVQAMQAGGLDEQGRPKLAVGRASWEWIGFDTLYRRKVGGTVASFYKFPDRHGAIAAYDFPIGTFAGPTVKLTVRPWRAMVPTIPPSIRPASNLDQYHILWEAEWQATPPRDPLLLRKLNGNLYVVLAVWDLTELERAVLGAVRLRDQSR